MSSADIARCFALSQPKLRAYIRSQVFNRSDVDDILQDVAVIAIESADRFDASRSIDAWMLGIARHRVLKYFEKNGRRQMVFSTEVVEAMTTATEDEPDNSESLEYLRSCMQEFDDETRRLIVRRHQPGTTARELALEGGYTDTQMSRKLNAIYTLLMKCVQQKQMAQA